jgi:hypothetical protein
MAETLQTPSMSALREAGDPIAAAAADRVEDHARRIRGDATSIGVELAAAIRDSATALFEEQRNRAADEIAALGEVLRRAVESLDRAGGTGGVVARCGEDAARQIDDFAARLRHRSWSELSGDVENFARRYPMMFIATATGLGLVAGRFLAPPVGEAPPQSTAARQAGRSGARRNARGAVGDHVSGGVAAGVGGAAGGGPG